MQEKKVLIVGGSREVYSFSSLLTKEGFVVSSSENAELAYDDAKKFLPRTVVFIHPPYWERVAYFAEHIRKEKGLERLKIVYLSSEIEGNDQPMLQKYGVRTFTLGPVPEAEIIRFIKEDFS